VSMHRRRRRKNTQEEEGDTRCDGRKEHIKQSAGDASRLYRPLKMADCGELRRRRLRHIAHCCARAQAALATARSQTRGSNKSVARRRQQGKAGIS